MAYPTDRIAWSSKDYNVCQFLARYGNTLPQVVKVVQGFHGDYHEIASIGNDEVLRIHSASTQVRILGKDTHGQTLSVPVEFGVRLQIVHDPPSAWPPMTLTKLLEQFALPIKVRFPQADLGRCPDEDLGIIQLESQFEQRHVFANCILLGKLDAHVRIIPCQLDQIRFVVAKGFENKDKVEWKAFIKDLDDSASELDYDGFAGASDIAMYAPNAVTSVKNIYSNLIPQRFVKITSKTQRESKTCTLSENQTGKEMKQEISKFSKRVKSGMKSVAKSVKVGVQTHVPSPSSLATSAWGRLKRVTSKDSKLDEIEEDEVQEEYEPGISRDGSHKYESMTGNLKTDNPTNDSGYLEPTTLKSKVSDDCHHPIYQNIGPKPPVIMPKPSFNMTRASNPTKTMGTLQQSEPAVSPKVPRPLTMPGPKTAPRPNPKAAMTKKKTVNIVLPIKTERRSDEVSGLYVDLGNGFVTLHEVPKDISNLSVDGVSQCLRLMDLDESVVQTCISKRLDGQFLEMINEEQLRKILEKEFKLSTLDTERVILFAKRGWRQS